MWDAPLVRNKAAVAWVGGEGLAGRLPADAVAPVDLGALVGWGWVGGVGEAGLQRETYIVRVSGFHSRVDGWSGQGAGREGAERRDEGGRTHGVGVEEGIGMLEDGEEGKKWGGCQVCRREGDLGKVRR
jgi:hypothetical protein